MKRNKFRVAIIVTVSFAVGIVGVGICSYVLHYDHKEEATVAVTQSQEQTTEEIPSSIGSKAFEEVEVKYEVDLSKSGGPLVPYAVYEYRANNVVESGTIVVKDFWYEGDGITVSLDVNGTMVEYTFIPENPED